MMDRGRRLRRTLCGADTFGVRKPNPEVLRRTIAAAGARLEGAIMIGDSLTARAAGVPVIAVDFGYTERPVSQLGPDRIIRRFTQQLRNFVTQADCRGAPRYCVKVNALPRVARVPR